MVDYITKDQASETFGGEASLTHGFWFHFDDGDLEIAVNARPFHDLYLFANGEKISYSRDKGYNAIYEFSIEGSQFEILILSKRLHMGEVQTLLVKDGEIIDRQSLAVHKDKKTFWRRMGICACIGGLIGFFGAMFIFEVLLA